MRMGGRWLNIDSEGSRERGFPKVVRNGYVGSSGEEGASSVRGALNEFSRHPERKCFIGKGIGIGECYLPGL